VQSSAGAAATATAKTKQIVVMMKRMMEVIGTVHLGRGSVHLGPFIPLAIRFLSK
jgi:hypothetical protein